jgi:hypothetical protein
MENMLRIGLSFRAPCPAGIDEPVFSGFQGAGTDA